MREDHRLWTPEFDAACPETLQLVECVPQVLDGTGKRCVYVGASWARQLCLPTLLASGWECVVVESFAGNAQWLANQGLRVVHGLIQDCLELLGMADAVFFLHGPEHCSKEDAMLVAEAMAKRPLAVLMAPLGGTELDGPQYSNPREAHRWFVQEDDFPGWGRNVLERPGNLPNLLLWRVNG
jgi:hypothetical protein